MSFNAQHPRLLLVDSGLGGLSVLRAVRHAIPEASIRFVADDSGFPYGSQAETTLIARLIALIEHALRDYGADCLVLACNTASTIALKALRARLSLPVIGTVPAIKPAAALTKSGLVSVLATPATVGREYTRELIEKYGPSARFTLVGAPGLATLAEAHAAGETVDDDAVAREIAPCFVESGGARTDVVVLGCTHYPLLLDKFEQLAPWPVVWLDPAPAIARRIANVLAEAGHIVGVGARAGVGYLHFTSGRVPPPSVLALLKSHRLELVSAGAAFAA